MAGTLSHLKRARRHVAVPMAGSLSIHSTGSNPGRGSAEDMFVGQVEGLGA
jgi:hypothetical protein